MTELDRKFLSQLCNELEATSPGVVAGFEGFVTSHLGDAGDGFLVVEVFNVSPDKADDVLQFAEARARTYFDQGGGIISFGVWTQEETQTHFKQDVEAIRLCHTPAWVDVSTVSYSVGTTEEHVELKRLLCGGDAAESFWHGPDYVLCGRHLELPDLTSTTSAANTNLRKAA